MEKIGFEVDLRCNSKGIIQSLTYAKIGVILEEFLQKLINMNDCPMVAVVLSSHGGPGRFLIDCADLKQFDVERDLLQKFDNKTLPCMIDKPKLFFFQFCRGSESNKAIKRPQGSPPLVDHCTEEERAEKTVPESLSDAIIAYSTLAGKLSFRRFFFETICKVFQQKGLDEEVTRLFKMVAAEMKKKISRDEDGKPAKQVIEIDYINFSKDLYFKEKAVKEGEKGNMLALSNEFKRKI